MEYTEAQRAAIGTLDEPLLIVACAGSGKTQVISQRIVEILRRPGVEPKNIVAFTFTEKAAAELKERVTTLVTAEFGDMTGLAELFIGTMHGYARDLLQTYVPLTFKRNVLSDIQTRLFIDRQQPGQRADRHRRGGERARRRSSGDTSTRRCGCRSWASSARTTWTRRCCRPS